MIWFKLFGSIISVGLLASSTLAHKNYSSVRRRDILDLIPPISGWPTIALNIRHDAELQQHVERYVDIFRYIQSAEKNSRLDPSIFRKALLATILVSLDSASKLTGLLGPVQVKFRKDFEEAVESSLANLNRVEVQNAISPIFPIEILKTFLQHIFKDIVWSSNTSADANELLNRFIGWLEYWRSEIRDMDEYSLRRIVHKKKRISTRKFVRQFRKYRNAVKNGDQKKVLHYEKHLIYTLSDGSSMKFSFSIIVATLVAGIFMLV